MQILKSATSTVLDPKKKDIHARLCFIKLHRPRFSFAAHAHFLLKDLSQHKWWQKSFVGISAK